MGFVSEIRLYVFTFASPKADSHIACRTYAVPLPCRATKGLECVVPIWFTQCGCVWFTLAMRCPCHLWPCRSSQGHGTARPLRDGVWTTCSRSASSGYHMEFHEVFYQMHTNLRCKVASVKPNTVCMVDEKSGSSTLQKVNLVHCWTSSSDIFGYHADIHEWQEAVGAGQGRSMACV